MGLAHCGGCGHVFPLAATPLAKPPAEVRGPAGVRLRTTPTEVQITVPWRGVRSWSTFVMTFLLGTFVAAMASQPGANQMRMGLVAVGGAGLLYSLYVSLATLFNRTELTATRAGLAVDHGPFPWPIGAVLVPRAHLARLTTRTDVKRTRYKGRTYVEDRHSVVALTRQGREVTLLAGCTQAAPCRVVAAALETSLGIAYVPSLRAR
jgi:hypothetical protein